MHFFIRTFNIYFCIIFSDWISINSIKLVSVDCNNKCEKITWRIKIKINWIVVSLDELTKGFVFFIWCKETYFFTKKTRFFTLYERICLFIYKDICLLHYSKKDVFSVKRYKFKSLFFYRYQLFPINKNIWRPKV